MSVLIQAASVIFFRAIYVSNREVIFIIPYHADYIPLVLNSHLRFISDCHHIHGTLTMAFTEQ